MQVAGQNIQSKANAFNSSQSSAATNVVPQTQQSVPQNLQSQNVSVATNPQQLTYPAGYLPPQNTIYPPSGANAVNIQIFNPSVGTPNAAPVYNVNAPCYPSGYYTSSVGPDGKLYPNASSQPQNNNSNSGTIDGNVNTGVNNGTIGNGNNSNNVTNNNTTVEKTVEKTEEKKKTEKRKIVELTDDYIKNLETYLDSQDSQVRLNAAKEVYARLEEDESRKDDKALTALINKMLQDPSQEIRFLALAALDGRICTGDAYTASVLQKIQAQSTDPLNQEAADASNILLKMSGKQVEKEFEVKDEKKTETKKEK